MIHLRRRWLVLGGLVLIVGGLLTWFLWPQPSAAEQLAAARARWAAQPLAHYRFVVSRGGFCMIDSEMRDEQLVAIYQNTCPEAPRSISDLFAEVEQDLAQSRTCDTGGCSCDRLRLDVEVQYNPQYGYPQFIKSAWRVTPWYDVAHWWRSLVNPNQGCPSIMFGSGNLTTRVLSLTALP